MKTLSKLSMMCVALMASTSLYAENPDIFEESVAADSVNTGNNTESVKSYHFGRREVIFDDNGIHFLKDRNNFDSSFDDEDQRNAKPYWSSPDDGKTMEYNGNGSTNGNESGNNQGNSKPKQKKYRHFSSSLSSLDLGVVQFASEPLSVNLDDDVNYMDNRGFQLYFANAAGLPIIDRHLGFCVGVGGKIDFYTFSNKNMVLEKGKNHLIYYTDTVQSYKKSKLTNTYLTVPMAIEVHAKGAWMLAGVEGNLLLWSNTKMKTTSGEKNRTHSNFYQNLFSYNLIAKVGVDCVGAYVRANLSPMFQKDKGPELYPFSAGVSFWF